VPGVTTAMLVALGEHNIKTVEDVADCATDDLAGWTERGKDKETVRHEGILDSFRLTREQIEDLIIAARVKAGWIEEAQPEPEPSEADGDATTSAEGAASAEEPSQSAGH
jgi:N utilization substance protein A